MSKVTGIASLPVLLRHGMTGRRASHPGSQPTKIKVYNPNPNPKVPDQTCDFQYGSLAEAVYSAVQDKRAVVKECCFVVVVMKNRYVPGCGEATQAQPR